MEKPKRQMLALVTSASAPAMQDGHRLLAATTDAASQVLVGAILLVAFILLIRESAHRVLVVFGAVAVLLAITYLTPYRLITFEGAKDALDLNVLLLLAGMMAVVGVLKTTGVFPWAAARLLEGARGRPALIQALLIWFTGAVSALADNVTTVIFLTPMVLEIATRTGVRPMAFLLPMVMAANLGGTATLIGDPPNIMIGSGAGLTFVDFVVNLTLPVLAMMVALRWFSDFWFRADLRPRRATPLPAAAAPEITDPVLLRWSLGISLVVFVGFMTHGLTGMPVAVPALLGAAALLVVQDVLYLRRHRPTHAERVHGLLDVIEHEIEWPTLSFFAFLFIAVGAGVETGLIDTLARGLEHVIEAGRLNMGLDPRGTLLLAALVICWGSGLLSAVVDNIPFVAVAIPIVSRMAGELPGDTSVLWWALALGACLGGNGSPIGASANVTVIGLAEKGGSRIGFAQFARFGATVTALSLLGSSLVLLGYVYVGRDPVLLIAAASAAGGVLLPAGVARLRGR